MLYRDLRSSSAADAQAALQAAANDGGYVTAWQIAIMDRQAWSARQDQLIVTVPDFLNYARLLNTGQAVSMARLAGLTRSAVAATQAGIGSIGKLPCLAKMDFWSVAEVLLRYDLALLPKQFQGTLCLHSHLTDFACVFERADFLRTFFNLGTTRAGIHTQQLPSSLTCISRWQLRPSRISFLCASGDKDGAAALNLARSSDLLTNTQLIAEMDSWPADLQRMSIAEQMYSTGLDGILVSPAATDVVLPLQTT
ncbi:MAG: hypothetical protein ACR2IE_17555 [Candidatus Sumerlaeaceae bacterium]